MMGLYGLKPIDPIYALPADTLHRLMIDTRECSLIGLWSTTLLSHISGLCTMCVFAATVRKWLQEASTDVST